MDTEFDDEALISAAEPVPVVGPDPVKFGNLDWREGYYDGLATAADLERAGAPLIFATGFLSGGLLVGGIVWACTHIFK